MKKISGILNVFAFALILFAASCHNESEKKNETSIKISETKKFPTPAFNPDSAYANIKTQVDFGPRIPGTTAHSKCADYLVSKLKSYNFETIVQKGTVQTFDKKQFGLKNIIGSFKPDAQSRIMICSHWDTRPWADEDKKDPTKSFDSANDGPSGVGIALEVARQINLLQPAIGIDIIFFDMEDYGASGNDTSWCLGSQFWANNLHKTNYSANFGILLDMVGGQDAVFPKEGHSAKMAPAATEKVWKAANNIGYGNHFMLQTENYVGIDDHIYVNRAGVPCIDIIEYNQATGGFGDYHHAHKDNMSLIDKNTLKAVGQTLLEVIYNEK